VAHVAADFALKPQRLFFGRFREYSLKRVFLSAVTAFFSRVVTFSFGKGSTFSRLVEAYGVSLMLLALWAVRSDFFGNIHVVRFPACNRENIGILIPFPLLMRDAVFSSAWEQSTPLPFLKAETLVELNREVWFSW
jgi:hypothetical protein